MPKLTIHHRTEYRYAQPAAFGEHRIMLRAGDSGPRDAFIDMDVSIKVICEDEMAA